MFLKFQWGILCIGSKHVCFVSDVLKNLHTGRHARGENKVLQSPEQWVEVAQTKLVECGGKPRYLMLFPVFRKTEHGLALKEQVWSFCQLLRGKTQQDAITEKGEVSSLG